LKIIIIIPTLNESNSIKKLINNINSLKIKKSLLFVDDKSTDGTQDKIKYFCKKNKNIKYLFKKKNLGIGAAIKSGFKYAKKNNFDYCVTMDADGTHNPNVIPLFINLVKKKKFDIISTNRFLKKNSIKKWSYLRIFITKLRYVLVKLVLDSNLDSTGNFRLYNLKSIRFNDLLLSKNNQYFFLIESLFYLEKLKYKIKEVPIYLSPRIHDNSKMRINHIINALINLIKLKFKYELYFKKNIKLTTS
jgi:dolichol-phosphate mannosyltransferase